MTFRMDQLLSSISKGLDAVESELVGSTDNHGKRIAILTIMMAAHLSWSYDDIIGVAACALMHDNALTEYIYTERLGLRSAPDLRQHCAMGERNISNLPFPSDVAGFIQYHHEFMDKSGSFGLNAEETPLGAQLICIADHIDLELNLRAPQATLEEMRAFILNKKGNYYTHLSADALLAVLDEELLLRLQDKHVHDFFAEEMPKWVVNLSAPKVIGIAETIASITDYKSRFTAKHSIQIANRACWMAYYYGLDEEICAKVYLAAALHDFGKLLVPTEILEKPGKLTATELEIVKSHAYWSYMMLKDVEGLDEICRWAVTHHRKLNGTGYPDLPERYLDLDFVSRMMACIDIYQAVREARPYHRERDHEDTMAILWDMAARGEVDKQITRDLDREMARWDGDVPSPCEAGIFAGLTPALIG